MLDLCISLVTTNERSLIEKCLESLFSDLLDSKLTFKIVIVDNASTDGIEEVASRSPDMHFIKQQQNEGFGKSHNQTFRAVPDAKYYLVLNPDTVFEPGSQTLRKMYDFMESHPDVGIAGPKLLYPDGGLQYSCYRFPKFLQPLYSRTKLGERGRGQLIRDHFIMKDFDHASTRPVDWVMGSVMFARGEAVARVGGFDDRFWMYAEDSDWCRRMWNAGWKVYYFHEVSLSHIHGRFSARVPGVVNALLKNRYARVHLYSWLQYSWKWRNTEKNYGDKEYDSARK